MRSLIAALLLLPLPAWAANNVDWTTPSGNVRNRIGQGECIQYKWTIGDTAADNSSRFIAVSTLDLNVNFTPDDGGETTAARAKIYACTSANANTCHEFKWDSDGDGVVDNSELDHSNDMKKGLAGVRVAGYIYFDPTADPAANNAVVLVCAAGF